MRKKDLKNRYKIPFRTLALLTGKYPLGEPLSFPLALVHPFERRAAARASQSLPVFLPRKDFGEESISAGRESPERSGRTSEDHNAKGLWKRYATSINHYYHLSRKTDPGAGYLMRKRQQTQVIF